MVTSPNFGFRHFCMALTILALCVSSSVVSAKGKDKEKEDKSANIVKSKTDYSLIVNGKTYIVADDAKITVDGKKSTFKQVQVGMKVTMTTRLLTSGKGDVKNTYEAQRISARTVKEKPKKGKKKK